MDEMVSVIIPVYNTEKYVKKCMESVLNQTYSNIQLIVVNDGSTDNSLEQIRQIEDPRITVISKQNEGVSVARNCGLDVAEGTYVLFVDSDDTIDRCMIETLINNLRETGADISCCQYDYNPPRDIGELEVWDRQKMIEEFMRHKRINGSLVNKLMKRELIGRKMFDTEIRYGEDALFLWDVMKYANRLCMTDRILYHVMLHSDSSTGGGFKPIRMQSHIVWRKIVEDTQGMNKVFYRLAKAQLGNMAFFSWFTMLLAHYESKEYEQECRKLVAQNLRYMLCADFVKSKVKVCACILAASPMLAKIIAEKR